MNELIKITTSENGDKLVSARELHEFLESKQDFSTWIKGRINKYIFEENVDYTTFHNFVERENSNLKSKTTEYIITMEMAKELSMVENNEQGRKARKYFIQCERVALEVSKKALLLEQIYNGGQGGILASKQLTEIEVKEATKELTQKIEEQQPMVEFTETVLKSSDNILVRQLSKIIKDEGINIGEKKLYAKLREWNYIMSGKTEPTQVGMNLNLFYVEENTINTAYGIKLTRTTKVTPKGQVFIVQKLKRELAKQKDGK